MDRLIRYCKTNWQFLLNIYLFVNFLGWTLYQGHRLIRLDRFDWGEALFFLQNAVLTAVVVLRRPHRDIEKNVFSQCVALVAFFSGAAFMGQAQGGSPFAHLISEWIMAASCVLGSATLLNLGRSFGILIAVRKVKTTGLYSIIRHPMYFTDILLRIGFVIGHASLFTYVMLVASTLCYCWRAVLEERFLSGFPEYREYMARVKYRLIPYVF
jgi:protein-S-isoprenylcysteine O-methyltransferase Ste14